MFRYKLKTYFRILKATWATFGPSRKLAFYIFVKPAVIILNDIGLFLDEVFFPDYRRVKIEKPTFIIGHPRSGTTLLHRLLAETGKFVNFELWQTLVPSIVGRKLVGPIIMAAHKNGKDVLFPEDTGHGVTLRSIEEEEALFMQIFNGAYTVTLSPLAFADGNCREFIEGDSQPEAVRRDTIRFLKCCFQRQIYATGRRHIMAKMPISTFRVKSLLETFPDAKFIHLVRSPHATIPSHLSLQRAIFNRSYRFEKIPDNLLQLHFRRQYAQDVRLYAYMEELIGNAIFGPEQLMTITYDMLIQNLESTLTQVFDFAEVALDDQTRKVITRQIQGQTHYRPKHRNLSLEHFGLSRERLAKDLKFVFDRYGFRSSG